MTIVDGEEQVLIPFDFLAFMVATDGLKREPRTTMLADGSRPESVAEHCWHLSLLALVLEPHAPSEIDLVHVRDLITIHDLVEVYAGDTWFYADDADTAAREAAAAHKLLALLPEDGRDQLQTKINEFQAQETLEARYVRALDVLHPMVISYAPGGFSESAPRLRASMILDRKRPYLEAFPVLWEFAVQLVECGIQRGVLDPD
jgi:putative hydrolase of HD superfamily